MTFRYYWEDFTVGRVFEYGARTLSEADIVAFARDWDPQRFHVDGEAAKHTHFGGLVASGWHTGCVMMRLMCDAYLSDSSCVGSPGIEEWRFAQPVRPGDTLRYRATVLEARPSASKPGHGIVKFRWELLNQRGEVAVSMIGAQFFLRREATQ
jgi:acyl dehydratase